MPPSSARRELMLTKLLTIPSPLTVQTICGKGVPVAEHLIEKDLPGRSGSVIVKTVMNVGGSSANANSPLA
ncbi:hypothetical protein DERF_001954 [Dermatophagoides farinae]|uniref:Uncharacterized protein n=1 Tax=Dermatophagoides farinae TaxID=6954 RepID=A0A922IBZ0_DERFA|nr:hypothetical protein DERF_001954 [Dermatophagoides farinae]